MALKVYMQLFLNLKCYLHIIFSNKRSKQKQVRRKIMTETLVFLTSIKT